MFTLILCHKSILSGGEITDSAERTSALLHEHLSVWIKTRLERHLLLKSRLRIDARGIAMHSEISESMYLPALIK